ncbi:hypothetical protein ACIOHS_45900 [Streptomyces sp. NPDC088253]|uniref:hypothetical protein n=1 Tax=Streptomyces sp. NPDC088253 TaxID=3365846 RepID=UPI00381EE0EB
MPGVQHLVEQAVGQGAARAGSGRGTENTATLRKPAISPLGSHRYRGVAAGLRQDSCFYAGATHN